MGSSYSTKIKVGITTIIALLMLVGGVLWVKEFNPATPKLRFSVVFTNGKGISGGDPIVMSGIKIGEVSGIALSKDMKAEIQLFITKRVDLTDDSIFEIKDVGLMGDKMLVITPGTSDKPLVPGKVYIGTDAVSMTELTDSANDVMRKLSLLEDKFDKDLDIVQLSRAFQETLDRMQQVFLVYEEVGRENKKPLNQTINNLNDVSNDMRTFLNKNDAKLTEALDSFQNTAVKINKTLDNLNTLAAVIDTVSTYFESDEGSLARFIKSDDLYEELRRTNANIDSFVTDFKRNPGKYTKDMQFKVRLF
ncbi:MlaD family protein [bacterium]|nr:MlaD family protein [bacterium]